MRDGRLDEKSFCYGTPIRGNKSVWGWVLAAGSLAAIVFGVLMSLSISIRTMSLLDIIIILVLLVGGLGLFARSLRGA